MSAVAAIVRRDLILAARAGGSGILALVFFLMVIALVPFAIGPDLNLLARIGPAILWIAALLATLVGLDRLFQADEDDGSLDLLRLSHAPMEALVVGKVAAHWLVTGLPLALASPVFGLLLAMTPGASAHAGIALGLGTPALTFVGAVGAALTATLRRGGLILPILVMPLTVPTLIFGVAASDPDPEIARSALVALVGLTLAAAAIGTIAAAAALRSAE